MQSPQIKNVILEKDGLWLFKTVTPNMPPKDFKIVPIENQKFEFASPSEGLSLMK